MKKVTQIRGLRVGLLAVAMGLCAPPTAAVDDSELELLLEREAAGSREPESEAAAEALPVLAVARETPVAEVRAPAPAPARRQLEEIVVTAQKTEQGLRDVPISVSALQGEFLQDHAVATLTEAAAFVPNVRVESISPSSPQVFIRGFGTNTFNPSFEPSVGLVQDEVFFGRGAYFTESMFDLARVEVLRGPQGTLFGKNTVAGVFNVVSRGAPADGSESQMSLHQGQWGERRLDAGFGARLNDQVGARIAVLESRREGRVYNTKLDRREDTLDQSAQRLRLSFDPTAAVGVELIAQRSDTEVNFWPRQLLDLDADTRAYLENFDPAIEDDPYDFRTSFDIAGALTKSSSTLAASTRWDHGDALGLEQLSSTVVVAYSRLDIWQYQDLDVSPADLIRLAVDRENFDQRSLEWRVTGSADSLFGWRDGVQFVAGIYAYDAGYHIDTSIVAGRDLASYALTNDAQQLLSGGAVSGLPGGALGALGGQLPPLAAEAVGDDYYRFDFYQSTRALALFGQFTWDLGPRWALTPGLRLGREDKRADASGQGVCRSATATQEVPVDATQQCVVQALLAAENYSVPGIERSEVQLSPKLSLQYRPRDEMQVFATWGLGFKSGGVNAISFKGVDLEFEPERAQTLELGIKSEWFDRSLGVNATVYEMQIDKLQVLAFNSVLFDVTNAGAARSRGLELDLQWLTPLPVLSLNASLGLLDARYRAYPNAPAPVGQGMGARQDLSGRRMAFAPPVSATLTPTLDIPWGNWTLNAYVSIRHQGGQYSDTDLDPATYEPAHAIWSAQLRLARADEAVALALGGKNLSDRRVLNQVIDSALFPGTYLTHQMPGRELYATLAIRF